MIKKTILFATLLFIVYNVTLILINPSFYIPQNQSQENIIKGQEYLHSARPRNYVIVGSSLSTKIDMNILPENFFNLSFRGQSIYDGLEIIKKSGLKPEKVFIETNMYLKNIDKDFSKDLFMPVMYTIREDIPALQEKNRPVNSLTLIAFNILEYANEGLAYKIKSKLGIKFKNSPSGQQVKFLEMAKNSINKEKTGVFKEMIKDQVEEYKAFPEKDSIDKRIALLENYIHYLKEQNIQVVFFEMPIEEELCSTPRTNFLRNELQKRFPVASFLYIQSPDCRYFTTKDGIHLEDESAILYTQFLLEEVSKLNSKN